MPLFTKILNLPHLIEECSYMFFTFFINLPEMKGKSPRCSFETYHLYADEYPQHMFFYGEIMKIFPKLSSNTHHIYFSIQGCPEAHREDTEGNDGPEE